MPALKILNNPMKTSLATFITLSSIALANDPPTVVVQSAEMRPSTTLMDVVFRVNDPDDSTVKVRALAFVDGVRSFANILRPVTFVEGTDIKIGDAIPTNVDHTLTWDVAADWNIDLGEVVFEVLAVDSNGMLPFDGITIPAAAGEPELQINKIGISDEETFDALLWFYASGDANMEVVNGVLQGSVSSGVFESYPVVVGDALDTHYAQPFLYKLMNITWAGTDILRYAESATRTTFPENKWLTTNWPYEGTQFVHGWGQNAEGQTDPPVFYREVTAIESNYGSASTIALKDDGTLVTWGYNPLAIPVGLSNVTAVASSPEHALALTADGSVVAWGENGNGECDIPDGLSGVTDIAAGEDHSLALMGNGTVVVWGSNVSGQQNIPPGLSDVIAIEAGAHCSLAITSTGSVVSWGSGDQTSIPAGLSGVVAIAVGYGHALALKADDTVVPWGRSGAGVSDIPPGLSGVTAVAAGRSSSYALKNDGTIVAWGTNGFGQTTIPPELSGVSAITAGAWHFIAITTKAP